MSTLNLKRFSARDITALGLLCCALPAAAQQKPPLLGPLFSDTVRDEDILRAQIKPISGVQVTPLAAGAVFSFQTRDLARPNLRIGTTAPVKGPQGREPQVVQWGFPADEVASVYVPRYESDGMTQHTLQLRPVLAPNTTYHYIIEAGGAQEIGSFSTISRRVKVVFQKVRVLKGGDEGGIGDTFFQFFANYDAQTNRNFVWLGARDAPLQVPDGAWVDANKEFTLNNVDELRLAVNGYDEDFLTLGAPPATGSATSVVVGHPQKFASHNNAGAWNVAAAEINFATMHPVNKAATFPFTLRSIRTESGEDVEFEVAGFYTITPLMSKSEMLGEAIKNRGGIRIPKR